MPKELIITEEQVQYMRDIALKLIEKGVDSFEACGTWIWLSEEYTQEHPKAPAILAIGGKWSKNKSKFYFPDPKRKPRGRRRKLLDMTTIRRKYGTTKKDEN